MFPATPSPAALIFTQRFQLVGIMLWSQNFLFLWLFSVNPMVPNVIQLS